MEYTYSTDTPSIVRSQGKIKVPYNIEDYTDIEGNSGHRFYYFDIDDDGQDITDPDVIIDLGHDVSKYIGIEIFGVMCSATAEDQWGLSSIKSYIEAGSSTMFHFSNGNTLLLTPENIDAFSTLWIPFRQSFFAQ